MDMTPEETAFYLDILTTFRTIPQILKTIPVSRPTLQRWIDYETHPSGKYRKYLQKALDELTDDLKRAGGVRAQIGQFIEDMPEPKPRAIDYRLKSNRQAIQALLAEMLGDGKEHRSSKIIEDLRAKGHSRASVQMAAHMMGVKKNHIGLGRHSYSLWSLK